MLVVVTWEEALSLFYSLLPQIASHHFIKPEKVEASLCDWIPGDSRLGPERLECSCNLNNHQSDKHSLFIVSAHAPKDCSPDVVKVTFYQKLHDLLHIARRVETVLLARDMDAREGRLSRNQTSSVPIPVVLKKRNVC